MDDKKQSMAEREKENFERALARETTQNYTRELVEQNLFQLFASNTDKDKTKLSAAEAQVYLKAYFDHPPLGSSDSQIKMFIKRMTTEIHCRRASFGDTWSKESIDALQGIGEELASNTALLKAVAQLVKNPSNEQEVRLIADYTTTTVNEPSSSLSSSASLPPNADQKIVEAYDKAYNKAKSTINALKDIYEKNPETRDLALHIPDLTALSNLSPDATCKAVTGKPVGVEM